MVLSITHKVYLKSYFQSIYNFQTLELESIPPTNKELEEGYSEMIPRKAVVLTPRYANAARRGVKFLLARKEVWEEGVERRE